jgi:hypothetical protein
VAKPKIIQNEEHIALIKALYPTMDTAALAERLGYTRGQIIDFAYKHGIRKTSEYRSWSATEVAKKSPAHFKKGCKSYNARPVGSTRKDFRGNVVVKVAEPRVWVLMRQKVWEDVHGPVPKGYLVVHKDGDKENYSIDNLALVSKKEMLLKNSVHNLPPELKELVLLRGNILRCITVRERKNKREK